MTRLIGALALATIVSGACTSTDKNVKSSRIGEGNKSSSGELLMTPDGNPGDAVMGDAAADPAGADAPPVTFTLKNTADEDLVFSIDKGWQPVIFAYFGTPPNATPIIMFPKHCTAACDAAPEAVCPYCPEPEKVSDIKKAEKRQIVAPGESVTVPWDGLVFKYQKTKGKTNGRNTRCECHNKEPAPEQTYVVRACGLRLTTTAKSRSTYQCVQGSMTFPFEGPQEVVLEFPKPEKKKKK